MPSGTFVKQWFSERLSKQATDKIKIMHGTFNNIHIEAIAASLPAESIDLDDLAVVFGERETARIITSNGISRLRVADEDTCASDLCAAAAKKILGDNGADRVDGLVFVSQTPDHTLPATSAQLQHGLGISTQAVVFDINQGCSGYVYGLLQAALLIGSGCCSHVLVCAGDVLTRYVNPLDKGARMVFGDAGSATLVSAGSGKLAFQIMGDGAGASHLMIPAGGGRQPRSDTSAEVSVRRDGNLRCDEDLYMNGLEVMNFSLREVPRTIQSLLEHRGWKLSDVTPFALHQANRFMLEYLARILKVSPARVPVAMETTGNTSAASIPLMLSLQHAELAQAQQLARVVLCGFGVGLSCAAMTADLSETRILAV